MVTVALRRQRDPQASPGACAMSRRAREPLARFANPPLDTSDAPRGYFIHFAFDSDNLSSTYQAHLENLSEALSSKEMSSLCLMLVGHTDAVGASTYNQRLSERRASSVKNYLVA